MHILIVYSIYILPHTIFLGDMLPEGFPDTGRNHVICQRFDKESRFGKTLGYKDAYYVTLYDTHKRIPLASMVTVRSLGDNKWPDIPFMVERGIYFTCMYAYTKRNNSNFIYNYTRKICIWNEYKHNYYVYI